MSEGDLLPYLLITMMIRKSSSVIARTSVTGCHLLSLRAYAAREAHSGGAREATFTQVSGNSDGEDLRGQRGRERPSDPIEVSPRA
jgi:hypothetical protein